MTLAQDAGNASRHKRPGMDVSISSRLDVGDLLALGTIGDLERDALALFQGIETAGIDGGEMSKKIFAATIGGKAVNRP